MKLNEQISILIKEVEKARCPEDKAAYKRISEYVVQLKEHIKALYHLAEVLKELDTRQGMIFRYLPNNKIYDAYGSRTKTNDDWSYMNLANEKKKLLSTMNKLKTALEGLGDHGNE
ncbi:MAG: hypothetical protein K0S53_2692 [Bacteroidetes bacterium]|jgi:hypothetical protein|nr:hypothetical protein [Bacteroidota bacterium]